jgi:hypothetical protein
LRGTPGVGWFGHWADSDTAETRMTLRTIRAAVLTAGIIRTPPGGENRRIMLDVIQERL